MSHSMHSAAPPSPQASLRLLMHATHPSTAALTGLSGAPPSRRAPPTSQQSTALPSSSALKTAERVAAQRQARADHLPSRGPYADAHRVARHMAGLPPLGSRAEIEELSEEEYELEALHERIASYGHDFLIPIGETRTHAERESSQLSERSMTPDGSESDAEGGPGAFVGGHTGHAAAEVQAAVAAERREGEAAAQAGGEQAAQPAGPVERDLDADVEDMDA